MRFMDGLYAFRKYDSFGAGMTPDLVIEKVLICSIKTTGELARRRAVKKLIAYMNGKPHLILTQLIVRCIDNGIVNVDNVEVNGDKVKMVGNIR